MLRQSGMEYVVGVCDVLTLTEPGQGELSTRSAWQGHRTQGVSR